jgi:hypothetical protein
MTEREWLACGSPENMLFFLATEDKDRIRRKSRLFTCACCYSIWHLLADERSRIALGVVERFADGLANEDELTIARRSVERINDWEPRDRDEYGQAIWFPSFAVRMIVVSDVQLSRRSVSAAASCCRDSKRLDDGKSDRTQKWKQCVLLRDIFGNPFRPMAIDPRWLTSTVVDLATAIYNEKAFDRMSILADALMDAGCDSDEMISHCRGKGPHVRGCWVVDLILGKE